jgi:hypothetical protein
MKTMSIVVTAFCIMGLSCCVSSSITGVASTGDVKASSSAGSPVVDVGVSLNFRGWYPWGGIQAASNGNTVTLNGKISTAGYVTEYLDTALKNKKVLLEIKNAAASNFSEDRMMKITVNKNDQAIRPLGITGLIQGEYIPIDYKTVEFVLPPDFDGKLGFVFYQADLKNLQITATYK